MKLPGTVYSVIAVLKLSAHFLLDYDHLAVVVLRHFIIINAVQKSLHSCHVGH